MHPVLSLSFLLSADDVDGLPRSPREVAVIGRSNVGKSSLLNAIAGQPGLARTSKTPGRTQLLNCFVTPGGATVVDLPGYGYAKASKDQRRHWKRRMDRYLEERTPLVMTLALIDGEVGPTSLDLEVLAWLHAHDVPFTVVATKHDKVKASRRDRRRRDLAAGCGVEPAEVVWTSADKGVNIPRLRGMVVAWLDPPRQAG